MSAVTVKKPYGCGDKGPPEPLSPAASHCSCSSDLPGCCGEDVHYYPKQCNFLLIVARKKRVKMYDKNTHTNTHTNV